LINHNRDVRPVANPTLRFPYCLNRTVFVFVCVMGIVANYNKFNESSDEITNVVDNILACFNSSVVILFNVSLDFELISLLILQRDTNLFLLNFLINLRFFFFFFFLFSFFYLFPFIYPTRLQGFHLFFFLSFVTVIARRKLATNNFRFFTCFTDCGLLYFSDHLVSLLF